LKILLVDDNIKFRSYVKKLLYRKVDNLESVIECGDGGTAVDLYPSVKPDWVVMDIMLPILDGLKATRMILEKDPAAKVIILTQYNDSVYREEAHEIGARDFLLKENLNDILKTIGSQNN